MGLRYWGSRVVGFLLGQDTPIEKLPERVQEEIRSQERRTEILIGWVQFVLVLIFGTLYTLAPKTFDANSMGIEPVPVALGAYFVFTLIRLGLAYRGSLPTIVLNLSVVIDMTLLMSLIWSFHIQYDQPPSFYLKAPTLLYVFIFIALRALRFDPRFVLTSGIVAALGWGFLVAYAIAQDMEQGMITRDYIQYMTGNLILLGAEFDKMLTILVVTLVLTLALARGRRLLVRAVAEGTAAEDLSRFFSPEVAKRITGADEEIRAGHGEARDAAIVMLDLRGFTRLTRSLPPDDVIRLLAEYESHMVPVLRQHGGSIDKFLGDGIMATFGAVRPSGTYAADALRALEATLAEAERWQNTRESAGLPAPVMNGAMASGRVVFGAVGTAERLEYTVIGDAVNLAAKLEKANKDLFCQGLVTREALALAETQGFVPSQDFVPLTGAQVDGVQGTIDLAAIKRGDDVAPSTVPPTNAAPMRRSPSAAA